MRYLKAFGFSVVLIAMTALAPTAARAEDTTLCTVHEEPCSKGNIPSGIHMVASNPLFQITILGVTVNIVCETSLAEGAVFFLGDPQEVLIQKLTWVNCKRESNGASCTATTNEPGGSLGEYLLAKSALNLGIALLFSVSVTIACTGIPTCTYGGTPPISVEGAGHTASAGNGMVTASKSTVAVSGGGLCPKTGLWSALYEPLQKVYLVS